MTVRRSPLTSLLADGGVPPGPCTDAELAAVLSLLRTMRPRPAAITVGTSRDAASRATTLAVGRAWTERGGQVLDVVDWPEEAASWLRQARRLTAQGPDAWVVTGRIGGWVQLGRRLALSTAWRPDRTVATSSLADTAVIRSGGVDTFDGLRGAYPDGRTWSISRTVLVGHDYPEPTVPESSALKSTVDTGAAEEGR